MFITSKYLRYIIVCVALAAPLSGAQTQQPPAQNQQPFTLQVSTQLVIETVTVRDRDGKIIEDLTAKRALGCGRLLQRLRLFEHRGRARAYPDVVGEDGPADHAACSTLDGCISAGSYGSMPIRPDK